MAPYEAVYGRPCRSPLCWTEVGESSIIGPDMIRDTSEKVSLIRQRLLTAQSRQKSYADVRRRPLEFEVGDHIFSKVIPKRGVVRFEKRGKLLPRFTRPFEMLERVGCPRARLPRARLPCARPRSAPSRAQRPACYVVALHSCFMTLCRDTVQQPESQYTSVYCDTVRQPHFSAIQNLQYNATPATQFSPRL